MDIAEILRALRQHRRPALATFALVAALTLLAASLVGQRFQATATASVQPAPTSKVSTQLLDFLIPSSQERVESDSMRRTVARALPAAVARQQWTVRTDVPPGSGVLRITVVGSNEAVPVPVANAYAKTLTTSNLGTREVAVLLLDGATQAKASSPRATLLVSGLCLGLILAVLVALASYAVATGRRSRNRARRGPLDGVREDSWGQQELQPSRRTGSYAAETAGTGQ